MSEPHGHAGGGIGDTAMKIGFGVALVGLGWWLVFGPINTAVNTRARNFHGTATVTSGYVPGAPKSPAECKKRGGVDLGRGCEGFD